MTEHRWNRLPMRWPWPSSTMEAPPNDWCSKCGCIRQHENTNTTYYLPGGDEPIANEPPCRPLSATERKLAASLLKLAEDRFSNHSCNDYDLVKDGGLTPHESLEIRRAFEDTYYEDSDYRSGEDKHLSMDAPLMGYLADKL